MPVKARVAGARPSLLAGVAARHWCRWCVSGAFRASAPGTGALPRLFPRPRTLALAFLYSSRAGKPCLLYRVCCRPVWQLDFVRFFGEKGAFIVLAGATFELCTLRCTTKSCIYLACTLIYHAVELITMCRFIWRCRHCSRRRVFTPETLPFNAARAPAAAPSCGAERPVGASRPPH